MFDSGAQRVEVARAGAPLPTNGDAGTEGGELGACAYTRAGHANIARHDATAISMSWTGLGEHVVKLIFAR